MIDITVAPAGQQAIVKEFSDVDTLGKTLEKDSHFQAFAQAGEAWSKSAEVSTSVKQLEAWSKTQQAKDLESSGKAVEAELKGATTEIPNGVRIANAKLPAIEKRAQDLEARLKQLKPTPEMEAAFKSASWKNVEAKGNAFAASAKGQQLKKEIDEVIAALQTHVKVTDVPK